LRRQITEQDLAEFRRCPLRGAGYQAEPAVAIAEKLWAAAALASFRGEVWSVPRLRTEIEKVIQPVTPYELGYPAAAVSGSYAVVAKPKQTELHVVRLFREQNGYERSLDLPSMARWQHQFHAGGESQCFVLQWNVDTDQHYAVSYPLDHVRKQFIAVTENLARPGWAAPGEYCGGSRTKGCEPWTK
jgi:hypothetical protein